MAPNPDIANILGRTDLNFESLYFLDYLDPNFLDFQVPRSPNFWISRSPNFQTPPAPAPDEFSDPNLPPLPTHQRSNTSQGALASTVSGVNSYELAAFDGVLGLGFRRSPSY